MVNILKTHIIIKTYTNYFTFRKCTCIICNWNLIQFDENRVDLETPNEVVQGKVR